MDAALFNHLIDNARHLATVANALAVKSMLSQLTSWRRRVNLVHRKSKYRSDTTLLHCLFFFFFLAPRAY
jgi:hypothetical protein